MAKRLGRFGIEFGLIAAVMLISVLGFWDIYFGAQADPQPHHHLHLATTFVWMGLLLAQLIMIDGRRYQVHRKLGLAVLVAGPFLVAMTAMLSVHSAHKGLVSGEGDFLIVQNVLVTIETGSFIFMAFLLKANRDLHGSLLLGTLILFMGIALFFALISFAPQFRIEGPETFYRFQTAAMTAQFLCLAVGFLLFIRGPKNNWPFLIAGSCLLLNEGIRSLLAGLGLIDPLTKFVGSMSQPLTFAACFAFLAALLAATILPTARRARPT